MAVLQWGNASTLEDHAVANAPAGGLYVESRWISCSISLFRALTIFSL